MWTAKSFAREIKSGQKILSESVSSLDDDQKRYFEGIGEQLAALGVERQNVLEQISSQLSTLEDRLEQVVQEQDTFRKQCQDTLNILTGRIEEIAKSQRTISGKVDDVHADRDEVLRTLQTSSTVITKCINLIQDKIDISSDNIETMSYTIQELIRNIMNLDEGNRLIIAKLLLQEMGD